MMETDKPSQQPETTPPPEKTERPEPPVIPVVDEWIIKGGKRVRDIAPGPPKKHEPNKP